MDGSLEAAAKRDIELLKAAADSEKRHGGLKNFWQQLQRDRIASRINERGHRQGRPAVALSGDIRGATSEQKAVNRRDQCFSVNVFGMGRDDQRKHFRDLRECMYVSLKNGMCRVLLTFEAISHNCNDRSTGVRVIHVLLEIL